MNMAVGINEGISCITEGRRKYMTTKIILSIEGGVIHEVISNAPVEVLTMDYDTQGGDQESLRGIPHGDTSSKKCYVRFEDIRMDPPRLAKLWKVGCQNNSPDPNTKNT